MQVNDKAPTFSTTDENGKEVALKYSRQNGRSLFLSQSRHPRLHQGSMRVSRYLQQDQENRRGTAWNFGGYGCLAEEISGQVHFAVFPARRRGQENRRPIRGGERKEHVWAEGMGIARTTFVIGPDGKIKHIFNNVKPEGHAEEVLECLKNGA